MGSCCRDGTSRASYREAWERHASPVRGRRVRPAVSAGASILALLSLTPTAAAGAPAVRIATELAGPIAEWILFASDEETLLFEGPLVRIADKVHPNSAVRIVYHKVQTRRAIERRLDVEAPGARVRWQHSASPLRPWVRDEFVMGQRPDGRPTAYLHHPAHYAVLSGGPWQSGAPPVLREIPALTIVPTRVRLEGGSILADDQRVLIASIALTDGVDAGEFRDMQDAARQLRALSGIPAGYGSPCPRRGALRA